MRRVYRCGPATAYTQDVAGWETGEPLREHEDDDD